MLNLKPASSYYSQSVENTELDFVIESIDFTQKTITLQSLTKSIPIIGQIITASTCSLYISSKNTATLVSGDISSISVNSYASINKLFTPPPLSYKIISPNIPLGSLFVNLSLPHYHKQGFLGWSLIKDSVLLLAGNDLFNHSTVSFSSSGLWSKGNYRLVLGLYEPFNKGLVNITDRSWSINEPISTFRFGFEQDSSLPISL